MTTDTAPRAARRTLRPRLDHSTAMRVAEAEYDRVVTTLERLADEHWEAPTDCPSWDVRAMVGHIVGMSLMASSLRQLVRQQVRASRLARREGMEPIDALTALQVREHAGSDPRALIERLREVAPRAVRGRSRLPRVLSSRLTMPEATDGVAERWTIGYLFDVILTRDPFMHRIDIARATGVQVPPSAEHEGVIVADVVAEWADRHGQPFVLDLTGPAGGHWEAGTGGERIEMDPFDFCRLLSGRGQGPGLLSRHVPF